MIKNMINLKEMLLERNVNQSEKLGCLMAMADVDISKKLVDFGKKLIKDEDLYHEINEEGQDEYGREQSPMHITIRYGFLKDLNELDIRQLLKGQKEFLVETNNLDIFDTNQNFDVVKFGIKSPILNKLNGLSGVYPNKNDFPNYHSHLTLGYVKTGIYTNLKKQIKLTIPIKSICYSPISGGKSYFDLTEGNIHHDIDSKIARLEQEWDRLDSMPEYSDRQKEITKELSKLRAEKESQPLKPNDPKVKGLFDKMRQSTL